MFGCVTCRFVCIFVFPTELPSHLLLPTTALDCLANASDNRNLSHPPPSCLHRIAAKYLRHTFTMHCMQVTLWLEASRKSTCTIEKSTTRYTSMSLHFEQPLLYLSFYSPYYYTPRSSLPYSYFMFAHIMPALHVPCVYVYVMFPPLVRASFPLTSISMCLDYIDFAHSPPPRPSPFSLLSRLTLSPRPVL